MESPFVPFSVLLKYEMVLKMFQLHNEPTTRAQCRLLGSMVNSAMYKNNRKWNMQYKK